MVSVERILEFGKVPTEAELELKGDTELLSTGWPKEGAIEVSNVSARYREALPLSLDDMSFSIPSGARVGIVGRTGNIFICSPI
jgi:ABC-type bacteriocin/lantibiotic exporter with double-glycine peptidase domain